MTILTNGIERRITPNDTDCIDTLCEIIGSVQPTMQNPCIRFTIFEWTSQRIYDAILAAYGRGIDIAGLVDMRQSHGPTQSRMLNLLWTKMPRANFTLADSVDGQIAHAKELWTGWCEKSTIIIPEEYSDWHDALAKGIPVIVGGSLNWTDVAEKQVNSFDIAIGQVYAAYWQKVWNETKAWNILKHPAWQQGALSVMAGINEI